MPGKKSSFDETFLTERAVYRANIDTADTGPNDSEVPDIRLDVNMDTLNQDPGACREDRYSSAGRQYNAHLELFVFFTAAVGATCDDSEGLIDGVLDPSDNRCHATLRVWSWAEPVSGTLDGRWCLVHEQSVVMDTLISLRQIPAAVYRVTVSNLSADCSVDILEQHTE